MFRPALAATLLVLCASSAHALSCVPLDDRYVFSCDTQRCVGEFRVDEAQAFGACGRRPVVRDIDPQVANFLAPLIGAPAPGVYTITLPDRYWSVEDGDGTLVALLDRMKERLLSYEDRDRIDLSSLSPPELRQMIERRFGSEWLSKDAEHGNAQEARHAWESKARRAHALAMSLWTAYWASFVAALVWLVHSIHVFFFRLYQAPAQGIRRFASPWVAQFIIGAVGVIAAFLMPIMLWPGTLLVPAVVVVLLAEGWARYRRRHVA